MLMNAITDLQEHLGQEFRLRGFVKAELLKPEQARAMYRAGFRSLLCGFEAAHPRILENIQALMSIGHPGESAATAEAVSRWLVDMAVDEFDCTIITTSPGTPSYDLSVPHATMPGI